MSATIEPEPTDEDREAILAALTAPPATDQSWAETALLEGVEDGELDP